jgi:PTH1 family peptidyl-tRNA hydrolase
VWAIVGLGNPGRKYSATRHNVGLTFIKQVARDWKVRLRKKEFLAKMGEGKREEERVILAMPQTYMNRSGLAVKQIVEGERISSEKLVVVYDDLDIPLGEIRIRKEGGPGTHKGMNSVVQEIKTTKFPRIRVGIGPLRSGQDATSFVLSPFEEKEKLLLKKSLKKAQEALEMILSGEVEKAMNQYNQKGKTL